MRTVAEAARDQRDLGAACADEAADQVAGGAAGGAVVQADVGRARRVRQVGDQRDHRYPALGQRRDRLAHRRMLERHHRDAVATLAVAQQRGGELMRVEALDEFGAATHVERRPVLLRIADHVAQHADEAVGARGQHHDQAQRLRRERGIERRFGQVVEFAGGLQHALDRGVAHAGPPVQDAVDRRGGHACSARDVDHSRTARVLRQYLRVNPHKSKTIIHLI